MPPSSSSSLFPPLAKNQSIGFVLAKPGLALIIRIFRKLWLLLLFDIKLFLSLFGTCHWLESQMQFQARRDNECETIVCACVRGVRLPSDTCRRWDEFRQRRRFLVVPTGEMCSPIFFLSTMFIRCCSACSSIFFSFAILLIESTRMCMCGERNFVFAFRLAHYDFLLNTYISFFPFFFCFVSFFRSEFSGWQSRKSDAYSRNRMQLFGWLFGMLMTMQPVWMD